VSYLIVHSIKRFMLKKNTMKVKSIKMWVLDKNVNIFLMWFAFLFTFLLLPNSVFAYTITTTVNSSSLTAVGYTDGGTDLRQSDAELITTTGAGDLTQVIMSVAKVASPGDTVVVKVYANSGAVPTGAALGTSDALLPSQTNCPGGSSATRDETFTFSTPVALSASTDYWIALERTGSLDGTNFYRPCGDDAVVTNDFALKNNGTWSSSSDQSIRLFATIDEGGGGATTATSTPVDNANANQFYGVVLFLVGFWGTIWFFRKRA